MKTSRVEDSCYLSPFGRRCTWDSKRKQQHVSCPGDLNPNTSEWVFCHGVIWRESVSNIRVEGPVLDKLHTRSADHSVLFLSRQTTFRGSSPRPGAQNGSRLCDVPSSSLSSCLPVGLRTHWVRFDGHGHMKPNSTIISVNACLTLYGALPPQTHSIRGSRGSYHESHGAPLHICVTSLKDGRQRSMFRMQVGLDSCYAPSLLGC